MILVDTSVWVDHFRRGNSQLEMLLRNTEVLMHPFVVGELACGTTGKRDEILGLLSRLPVAPIASHQEVLQLIESKHLFGRGIGWVDAHIVASALLSRTKLLTQDKRLLAVASSLQIELHSS
jgi:hypothetical protein